MRLKLEIMIDIYIYIYLRLNVCITPFDCKAFLTKTIMYVTVFSFPLFFTCKRCVGSAQIKQDDRYKFAGETFPL